MMNLTKEYNLELIPTFDEGKNILEINNKVHIYEGNISNLNMFSNLKEKENEETELSKAWIK